MKKYLFFTTIVAVVLLVVIGCPGTSGRYIKKVNPVWGELLKQYRNNDIVRHLVFVQCQENSKAKVQVYEKDSINNAWTIVCETDGLIGRWGWSDNKWEGDGKTPTGDFGFVTAFGIKANPGTAMSYIDITDDLYAVDTDTKYYNRIIRSCNGVPYGGEHMWDYSPEYNYGIFLDYNREHIYGKGSAIFFHCKGTKTYTGGCVAVDEEVMRIILQRFSQTDRICIYPMSEEQFK